MTKTLAELRAAAYAAAAAHEFDMKHDPAYRRAVTKTYYVLLVRDSDTAKWGIEFGDYDRAVVVQEQRDMLDSNYGMKRKNTMVLKTTDQSADTQAQVDELNK